MIEIYDTTLRDGTQSEGFTLSGIDKLRIAKRLDAIGVAYIEGGWPGSNPKDVEFFERARDMEFKNSLLTAFGATCHAKRGPEDDENIKALLDSKTPVCTLFGKTWTLHVTEVLRTTPEDNLRIIEQSVAYLREQGRRVIYDAEHFFDGYKVTRWKRSRQQCAAEPRQSSCATQTAVPCPGRWSVSSRNSFLISGTHLEFTPTTTPNAP